jgi:hypothetical protein
LKIKGRYGAAEAAPLQNYEAFDFFRSLYSRSQSGGDFPERGFGIAVRREPQAVPLDLRFPASSRAAPAGKEHPIFCA